MIDLVNGLLDGGNGGRGAPRWTCQTLGSGRLSKCPVRAELLTSRTTLSFTGASHKSDGITRRRSTVLFSARAQDGCPAAKSVTGVGRSGRNI